MARQKFFSKKIKTTEGTFDSKLEYLRWLHLRNAEKNGLIKSLSRQREYELIPKQYIRVPKVMKTKVKFITKVAEQPCSYFADFVYYVPCNGFWTLVVEDTKSIATRTPEYRIKRKLMLRVHGIRIYEVTKPNQPIFQPSNTITYAEEESQTSKCTPIQD